MTSDEDKEKEEDKSWGTLLYDFTQDTTFHGVRYITAETPYLLRRIVWTTVILLATSFFFWFMSERLLFLWENPKAVDVEVIYTDNATFPAVTICNQNLFRTSATHRLGLHDVVEESFRHLNNGDSGTDEEGRFKDTAEYGFEAYRDHNLEGMGRPHATYIDVTSKVCRHVCVKLKSDSCCSVVYERATRTCLITPMDMRASGARLVPKPNTDYFQRRMCQVQTSANCTFETGLCTFVQDKTKTLSWTMYNEISRSSKFPTFDHTTMSADGYYLLASTKFYQPDTFASVMSPYILSGEETCIKFYYQLRGGALNILTKTHSNEVKTVWSVSSGGSTEWERGYQQLPKGYFRVVIEASSGKRTEALNVAIDDVDIGPCQRDQRCKESAVGQGYAGTLSTSLSGKTCHSWSSIADYLRPILWKGHNMDLVEESLPMLHNYCRNPDADEAGPWCVTDLGSGMMEYCDIPMCGCRPVEYSCKNGQCISRDLLCDHVNDCGDYSDEIYACNLTASVTCDFEDIHICGYISTGLYDSKLRWSLADTEYGSVIGVDMHNSREGDRGTMISPALHLTTNACLQVDHYVTDTSHLDVFIRYENESMSTLVGRELCDIVNHQGLWNTTYLMLPPGNYKIVFEAIVGDPASSRVQLDNITLLNENCTKDIPTTVMPVEMTTMYYEDNSTRNENETTTEMMIVTTTEDTLVTTMQPEPPSDKYFCDQRANISSGFFSFAKPEDCTTGYKLVEKAGQGQASRCKHLDRKKRITLAQCFNFSREVGANVINYYKKKCYAKFCVDDDLKLSDKFGGYDVYKMDGPEEDFGIACRFTDPCACGYKYFSSNIYDRWIREPIYETRKNHLEDTNNTTTNVTEETVVTLADYFMTIHNTKGVQIPHGAWTMLISPMQEVQNVSCIKFNYFTRYLDIKVHRYTGTGRTLLLEILHDGQRNSWHSASMTVDSGYFGLMFELVFGEQPAKEFAGINNIRMMDGKCGEEVLRPPSCEEEGENCTLPDSPFDCTFDDDDYCGYTDISDGPAKWIRSQQFEIESPGSYYIRSSVHLSGKSTVSMVTPYHMVHNSSCLQFYYFMHSKAKGSEQHLETLAISTRDNTTTQNTIWRVRTVLDNVWYFGQVEIPVGYYQLIFELNGDQVRGGVDDITTIVVNGSCPQYNCSSEEYACTSNFACIPMGSKCDGIPNCNLAEDEICGEFNETNRDDKLDIEMDKKDSVQEDLLEGAQKEGEVGSSMTLTDIYMKAAHQGEDFLYKCKFEGNPCSHTNFTKQVSDYGVCYTFNDGILPLTTAKTGSRFGLSLTLNIEQYEYMLGPQSDAGIKVFLHSRMELPQVRDLGFAIPPGTHALVGVRLNEAINLPPPHGDCAERHLRFYPDKYVHSRCMRECETDDVVAICGCRDAYMPGLPGLEDVQPPVCNLSTYFSCALEAINSEETVQKCDCPKPCEQTIYEPSLSQASLSVLSVDSILGDDLDLLLRKYQYALEATQRIKPDIFEGDLINLYDVHRLYTDILKFAKTYLGDFQDSSLAKIATATTTLVETIFIGDIEAILGDVDLYKNAYDYKYSDIVQLMNNYLSETKTCFQELEQLVKSSMNQNKTHRFLPELTEKCLIRTELMKETVNAYIGMTTSDEDEGKDTDEDKDKNPQNKFLPLTLNAANPRCLSDIQNLQQSLVEIANILESFGLNPDDVKEENRVVTNETSTQILERIYPNLHLIIEFYINMNPGVKNCMKEYVTVVRDTARSRNTMKRGANELINQEIFTEQTYNFTKDSERLRTDRSKVETLLYEYSYGKIQKLKYLQHFSPDAQSSEVLSNIDNFVERIKSRLTDPLRQRIQNIRKGLGEYYKTSMLKAAAFEKYLTPSTFHEKSSNMKIWKVPSPNLESPERFHDTGREHWRVWNREVPITTFATQMAPDLIQEGLDTFCAPLLSQLDNFEEQLLLNKQKLITAMNRIQTSYLNYLIKREIDHKFILNNFLTMDVYFAQLKHQSVKQIEAYQITQFLGDVGGFMGLLLGGSVLTVFELMDLIIFNFVKKMFAKKSLLMQLPKPDMGIRKNTTERVKDEDRANGSAPEDQEKWAGIEWIDKTANNKY